MEPNIALNEFYRKKYTTFLTITLQGLPGNHIYVNIPFFRGLFGYIWLLSTFVNSSCDIK